MGESVQKGVWLAAGAIILLSACGTAPQSTLDTPGHRAPLTPGGVVTPPGDDGDAAGFSLTIPSSLLVPQGGSASAAISITRLGGFAGPVTVSAIELPPGVTSEPILIEGDATTGTLRLTAASNAAQPTARPLIIHASSDAGSREKHLALTVRGAPGTVDGSFDGGFVVLAGTRPATQGIAEPDGGVLVIGSRSAPPGEEAFVTRLTPAGFPDETFGAHGTTGLRSTSMGSDHYRACAVVRDASGRIVVAGNTAPSDGTPWGFFVARLLGDGGLDTSFGGGTGYFEYVSPTGLAGAWDLTLQDDGKLVVAGYSVRPAATLGGDDTDALVARILPNGTLDSSFGAGGITVTDFGTTYEFIRDVAIDAEGRIVGAGFHRDGALVARWDSSGNLDSTFAGSGWKTFHEMDGANALSAKKGMLVIAGPATSQWALYVARLDATGALDETFGKSGATTITATGAYDFLGANDVDVEENGNILVAGEGQKYKGGESFPTFAAARLKANGALDTSFGDAGSRNYDYDGAAADLARIGDGRAYLLGYSQDPGNPGAALVIRIWE